MFLSIWSLTLTFTAAIALFLIIGAARTGCRVLRSWDPASDTPLQISLESETWLAATLVQYGLGLQILTLVIFVMAADQFSQVIAGAMCATGSLLANPYGLPALYLKLAGVFLYGFWLLLHQLDIRVETYPLVRAKFLYLLALVPLLLADVTLQTLYLAGIEPDIITSCCSVVFAAAGPGSSNLMGNLPHGVMLGMYYGGIFVLGAVGLVLGRRRGGERVRAILTCIFALGWVCFFFLALAVITGIISSYIYAMPYHRCPFCIIKPEYHYIGLGIYGTLIGATFFGVTGGVVALIGRQPELTGPADRYRRLALRLSLAGLALFTALTSYHYLRYLVTGGE
jgi:hypothetical protein